MRAGVSARTELGRTGRRKEGRKEGRARDACQSRKRDARSGLTWTWTSVGVLALPRADFHTFAVFDDHYHALRSLSSHLPSQLTAQGRNRRNNLDKRVRQDSARVARLTRATRRRCRAHPAARSTHSRASASPRWRAPRPWSSSPFLRSSSFHKPPANHCLWRHSRHGCMTHRA